MTTMPLRSSSSSAAAALVVRQENQHNDYDDFPGAKKKQRRATRSNKVLTTTTTSTTLSEPTISSIHDANYPRTVVPSQNSPESTKRRRSSRDTNVSGFVDVVVVVVATATYYFCTESVVSWDTHSPHCD